MSAEIKDPCELPARREFDFWVGDWELTWDGGSGSNRIIALYDGCAIQENFEGRFENDAEMVFRGTSLSAYDVRAGEWGQTWVDSQGGYLDFRGGMRDDRMILSRRATIDGQPVVQRMVWYNIAADDLDWNWERSDDGGATWQVLWHIHYCRGGK
jgi:hypothetical protein